MIEFTELRITPDSKYLVIGVKVKDESYYENVYLDSIAVDTQDTYSGNGHAPQPVFYHEFTTDEKAFTIELNAVTMGIANLNQLFFVQVKTKGAPSEDTPCGKDISCIMGTVANMYPMYQQGMNFIKELAQTCTVPQGFTDFILRNKAIELAVRTGNYTEAAKYYRMFAGGNKYHSNIEGGCSCGR